MRAHALPLGAKDIGDLWNRLAAAIRDYAEGAGMPGAMVSLSGGIDSAVVAALAVDALGSVRVLAVTYPSPYSSRETLADALELARRLGIPCPVVPIEPAMQTLSGMLPPPEAYAGAPAASGTLVEENLQARIRGILNMAISNRHGHLLLCTGNRSEGLTGYCTLYGDTCGGLAPLRDVYKTDVFALARWRNAQGPGEGPIPVSTIERPPSAELRPGQRDEDSLPPYPILDALLVALVDDALPPAEAAAATGQPPALAERVAGLVSRSAFKRLQMPPAPRT